DAIEFSGCARFEQRERCAASYQQIRDLLAAVVHGSQNRAFLFLGARVDEGGIGRDQLFHTTKLSCFDRLEELGFVRLGHGWIVFQVLGFQSSKVQGFKGSRVQSSGPHRSSSGTAKTSKCFQRDRSAGPSSSPRNAYSSHLNTRYPSCRRSSKYEIRSPAGRCR